MKAGVIIKIYHLIGRTEVVEMFEHEAQWYTCPVGKGCEFLIKPVPLSFLLELDVKVKSGELDPEEAFRKVFDYALIDWNGIQVSEECRVHPEYRRSSLDAFWSDEQLRNFVLDKVIEQLGDQSSILEKMVTNIERTLLASGVMKN